LPTIYTKVISFEFYYANNTETDIHNGPNAIPGPFVASKHRVVVYKSWVIKRPKYTTINNV